MTSRSSIRAAVILPSIFAAVVVGLLLGAVLLEGPSSLTSEEALPSGEPSPQLHMGKVIFRAVGMPWLLFFPFLWIYLGLLFDALSRSFGVGLPNPFTLYGLVDWIFECANVVGLLINVFILYSVGLGIDRGIVDRWRSPEPAERRRAILWLLVSIVGGVLMLACGGVVLHALLQDRSRAAAEIAQGQETLAAQRELLATFHSVDGLEASLRPDVSGFDVRARLSGRRGGAYRLELRVKPPIRETGALYENIETIRLDAGESRLERFIAYREIIAGYRREDPRAYYVTRSLDLIANLQPLLTPAEQTVLGLADLSSRPYGAWTSRASATAAFDVHFIICGSNYEIVHPRRNPGPCEGVSSGR
jgi:hypothetical protein